MSKNQSTSRLAASLYVLIFANLLLFMPFSLGSDATPFLKNLPMGVAFLTITVFAVYLRQERHRQP